mgnify:CR=1 FL=1
MELLILRRLKCAESNIACEPSQSNRKEYLVRYCAPLVQIFEHARLIALECEDDDGVIKFEQALRYCQETMVFEKVGPSHEMEMPPNLKESRRDLAQLEKESKQTLAQLEKESKQTLAQLEKESKKAFAQFEKE